MRTEPHCRSRPKQRLGFAATPLLLLSALIVAVILFVVLSNRQTADGPVPVIWDKTPCAFCAMHLGDPRFGAQLSTEDGTTYFYDDPGCLFLHERQLEPTGAIVHARWFRDLDHDDWIEAAQVSFRRCKDTPMNFGFGAVRQSDPAAVSLEQAAAEVLAR